MKPIILTYRTNLEGKPQCEFPGCGQWRKRFQYGSHCVCSSHYRFLIERDQGEERYICEAVGCYRISGIQLVEEQWVCNKHIPKPKTLIYDSPGTCYIDICSTKGTHEIQGKKFCLHHYTKIMSETQSEIRDESECNYVGCHQAGTVYGFNSRWCSQHYLEICKIREGISHDDSEKDIINRRRELQIRKDGNTDSGNGHRWYYLQTYLKKLQ